MYKKQHKKQYQNLFFLVFVSLFVVGCTPPVTPDKDIGDKNQPKTKDPRSIRLEYARQLLNQAINQKPPKQIETYFEVVRSLFKHEPGRAEYRLIEEALALIDKQPLTPSQRDQWIVYSGQFHFQQENYQQAEKQLQQPLSTTEGNLLVIYYDLRAQLFALQNQNDEAIQEYIQLHPWLTQNPDKLKNLETIWDLLGRYSLQQLEQKIANYSFGGDTQLLGWQQLAFLIKSTPNRYQLNQKLRDWQVNFPQHMAGLSFIQAQLKKRFELLLQPDQIAVLMPTGGKLAKPALTVRNGIMAAHFQQPLNHQLVIRFYDSSASESIWPTYKKAVYEGAQAIIGPLTKAHLSELSETDRLPVPTLALNQISDTQVTENLYQFGLIPEDEAAQIARSANQDGHLKAALMVPNTAWGKRMKKSFTESWEQQGGQVVESQVYQTKTHDYSDPIKKLLNLDESLQRRQKLRQVLGKKVEFTPRIRQDVDMIFLAAFPKQARQIPLQISYYHGENIPIYATSHIIARVNDNKANKDLNGIHYTDMPWLLDPNLAAISRQTQQSRASYQRLFALGVDTYLLLPYLHFLEKNNVEFFHGETGLLSVSDDGKIHRVTPMGTIKNGRSLMTRQAKETLDTDTAEITGDS